MAILSAFIITIIAEQFILVTSNFNPEEATTPETITNNDQIDHLKNLLVRLPPTEEEGTNRNGNAQFRRLRGFENLKLADVVGPRSCPFYQVPTIEPQYLKNMKKLWIVVRIVPKGESTYADQSAACGLHNFVREECKCLRYYLDFEKDETITIQSMSLHKKLESYRYMENRLVFIDKKYDVLQGQHIYSAVINATDLRASSTISPLEEELYPEFEPFALLGTDNYQTYAVYAACTHNTDMPLVWVAFAEKAYINGISVESVQAALNVMEKNNINFNSTVSVDQRKCLQIVVNKQQNINISPRIKLQTD